MASQSTEKVVGHDVAYTPWVLDNTAQLLDLIHKPWGLDSHAQLLDLINTIELKDKKIKHLESDLSYMISTYRMPYSQYVSKAIKPETLHAIKLKQVSGELRKKTKIIGILKRGLETEMKTYQQLDKAYTKTKGQVAELTMKLEGVESPKNI